MTHLQESGLCSCDYDGVRLCHLLPADRCQLERQQEGERDHPTEPRP